MSNGKTKVFPVPGGIVGHGKTYDAVVMREPTFGDYMTLSDPYLLTFSEGGAPMLIPQPHIIQAYVQRCMVEPKEYLLVETQAGLKVAREIATWINGFFRDGEAAATNETTATSPTISYSSSDLTPAT